MKPNSISPTHTFRILSLVAVTGLQTITTQAQDAYYTETPLFNPHPTSGDKKPWNVQNFGPVGIGIDLTSPGMTMVIQNVEKGSPAEKTGKLKVGQVIESINGKVLKGIDPRIILGDIITDAEAADGKVSLKIKGQGDVVVSIPVMGRYSATWPVNCPKSDKIVRGMADVLAKRDKSSMGGILFLLSTGEDKDLQVVRRWKSIGKCYTHPPAEKEILGQMKAFAKKEAAAKAKPKTGRNAFRPDYLILDAGKPLKKGSAFWTGNVLIDNTRGEARGMTVRTIEGKQYLLVEIDGFPEESDPDFQSAHTVYVKE